MLDALQKHAVELGKPHGRAGDSGLTDFAYALISRRVALGHVDAGRLWCWLEPFDASSGYAREARESLAMLFRRDVDLRRAIQRLVVLDLPGEKNLWQRSLQLSKRSTGLQPDEEDTVALLQALDPENRQDQRWRDVIALVHHGGEEGAIVRQAAQPFAAHRPDLVACLERLGEPRIPEWQIKEEERKRKQAAKWAMGQQEHRRHYQNNISRLRLGDYGEIVNIAKAYLNLFHDLEGATPHERVRNWLGLEIAQAAYEGFEAFLTNPDRKPTAGEIADSSAEGKHWDASYIIVAALAERLRTGKGFADLGDEAIMAGTFELTNTAFDSHANLGDLSNTLTEILRRRGVWEDALRRKIKPYFDLCRNNIPLYDLMHDDADVEIANKLAAEWLAEYENIPVDPESELVDRLLRSSRFRVLRTIADARLSQDNVERRALWDATGIVVDFDSTALRLAASGIDRDLIWQLRDRTTGRHDEGPAVALSPQQLAWIFNSFREPWPFVGRPLGSEGSRNDFDASDYLSNVIRRLGNDTSGAAVDAIEHIISAPADGYTDLIKSARAEQARKRVETNYFALPLKALQAVTADQPPATAAALQAFMVEELAVVQTKIRSDDVESWRGFFDAHGPLAEEPCRDHLLGLLRQGSHDVALTPEAHVAGDREVDIACSVGDFRLPIEIKGQWHSRLWFALDEQLDSLYSNDWRAEGRGIYLVLWFGDQVPPNKRLQRPPASHSVPSTSSELKTLLVAGSKAVQDGRVEVLVLDIRKR